MSDFRIDILARSCLNSFKLSLQIDDICLYSLNFRGQLLNGIESTEVCLLLLDETVSEVKVRDGLVCLLTEELLVAGIAAFFRGL